MRLGQRLLLAELAVMSVVFTDVESALADTTPAVVFYVRIGGVPVDATEATVRFAVNQPVGTCTVYVEAPRPASAELNATIEIEMGYPGASARRFLGFIPSDESVTDLRGRLVRIDGVGWASRLNYPEYAGIEIPGPVSLKDAFRSLCELRAIPTYLSDDTTAVDGLTTIMLGGNTAINNGHVRIDDTTDPLSWLQRVNSLFGYRVFDSPDSAIRQARVSGLARPQLSDPLLTVALVDGDYIQPTTLTNFREGPGTSYATIDQVNSDDIGRVISDEQEMANGFVWMQMTFPGLPAGWCALSSGGVPRFYRLTPDAVPFRYEDGVNCLSLRRERDLRDMANYIEVIGATYTGSDGGPVAIRNIPDTVTFDERLAPLGYRKYTARAQEITTDQQAGWVRNATEVDRAEPYELMRWEAPGNPMLQPADVVTLHAPDTHGITVEDYWLMSIDETCNSGGYTARLSSWRGAGQPLKAGNDCVTVAVPGANVIHAGTQTISYYKKPSPDSVRDPNETDKDTKDRRWVVERAFTVTDADYSSLRLKGRGHGTNSIKNKTAITGSCVEIWQLEDPSQPQGPENELRRVGSVDLPTLDEEVSKRRNYAASDDAWTTFSLPLPGSLKQGAAKLVIVCGKSDDGEIDDFELKDMEFQWCGVGEPVIAGSVDE